MKFSRLTFFSTLFLLIAVFSACAGNDSANENSAANDASTVNSSVVQQDNVEGLANIVKLDIAPDEATYSETNLNNKNGDGNAPPAQSEKKLVAVMKFSPEKAAEVVAQVEKRKPGFPSEIGAETWFPAELIAQSQLTGDESLKGLIYEADDFFQAPYNHGKLTRISNTDYFVLELTSF